MMDINLGVRMHLHLRDSTLHQLLAAYSAPAVAPAGISGSALSGAIGAALIVKVARLSERKLPAGPEREKAHMVAEKVQNLSKMLEDVVDHDTEVYAKLVRIKSAHAKGLATDEALERARKTATIVPGAMGRAALICINFAADLAPIAYLPALSDLSMGALLCHAAVEASILAVHYNLKEIADEAFCEKIRAQLSFFGDRAATLEGILAVASAPAVGLNINKKLEIAL